MTREITGRVERLSVTPVKGLAVHHPDQVEVSAGGVVGDRAFFLVTDSGELISSTQVGDLLRHRAEYDPISRLLQLHGPTGLLRSEVVQLGEPTRTDFFGLRTVTGRVVRGWQEPFSDIAQRPVRLVAGDTVGHDVSTLTLLGSSSVAELAARNDADPVDGRRFRMNVELSGTPAQQEDAWSGCELRLGEVAVRVGGPVRRCATTTRNPDSGVVDLQTLRMIGAYRGRMQTPEFGAGFYFGVYADVLTAGRIRVGDEVAPRP